MSASLRGRGWFVGSLSGWVLVGFCCALLSGCSGCDRTGPKDPGKQQFKADPLAAARELYRKATEAASFRDANEQVNKYLDQQPDALGKFQTDSKDAATLKALLVARGHDPSKRDDGGTYQKFLEAVVNLDKGELEEVGGTTFRLLDAHYLEGCFLLREISRSMPLDGLSPLERAEFCFRWVVRQVVLQEGRDEILPPQYVLKRGAGSSRERACVFFGLLQQLNLDACVIAVPDKSSAAKPWLVGVLITTGDTTDIYLFDARLGVPVPGPKGLGIATLAQLKAEPKLLDNLKAGDEKSDLVYDVGASQLASTEILLIAPLSALSARMRFLQDYVLADFDRINLAVRLPELMEKCDKLKAGPLRVWSKAGAQTPTSALRLFLPPEEGGIDATKEGLDKSNRLQTFEAEQTPRATIAYGFMEGKAWFPEMGAVAAKMQSIAQQVWLKFALDPAQQLVRGRLDNPRRLMRGQALVTEIDAWMLRPDEMNKAIADWRKRIAEKARQGQLEAAFAEDQWLVQILAEPDDEQAVKGLRPGTLSFIILRAVNKPLQYATDYLLALRWLEKAERLQVQYELLAAGSAADAEKARMRDKARDAWQAGSSYVGAQGLTAALAPATWSATLEAGSGLIKTGYAPLAVELADFQLQWLRRAVAARWQQARALEKTGKKQQAVDHLAKLQADIVTFEKLITRDSLRAVLYQPAPALQREDIGKIIERMAADTGSGGTLFWMRYGAAWRQRQLQAVKG
jgi:hypothetical protein